MSRSSWRLIIVLGALVLGAFAGAYGLAQRVTACVDGVDNSWCSTEVRPTAAGALIGAVLAGGTALLATRRWSRRG